MTTETPHANTLPKWQLWTGWVLTVLPAGLLLFSATGKFLGGKQLEDGFTHLGWPLRVAVPLGVVEACAAILLLIPRTAMLGAVLVTGYMGGAIATHTRIGEPFILQTLVGVVAWLGLFLREPRLRALLPLRIR
jgi:uncharacterized membrane protein YphA (DoxX/SURF4 family)